MGEFVNKRVSLVTDAGVVLGGREHIVRNEEVSHNENFNQNSLEYSCGILVYHLNVYVSFLS